MTKVLQPNAIGVALVEPQALVREALRALLSGDDGLAIVVAASSVAEISGFVQRSQVDLVLLALDPAGADHEAALDALVNRQQGPLRVLVLANYSDPAFQVRLIELGAMGLVLKDQTCEVLGRAIRSVQAGQLWFNRSGLSTVLSGVTRRERYDSDSDTARVQSLTAREREIVALVADGLTNTQLAERLCISAATVRNHLTSILSKLGLTDRFQLAVYAYRRGLVLCPPTAEMRQMSATMNADPGRRIERHAVVRGKTG